MSQARLCLALMAVKLSTVVRQWTVASLAASMVLRQSQDAWNWPVKGVCLLRHCLQTASSHRLKPCDSTGK